MQISDLKEGQRYLLAALDASRQAVKVEVMGERLQAALAVYDDVRLRFPMRAIHSVEHARDFYALLNEMWRVTMRMIEISDAEFGESDDPTRVVTHGSYVIDFAKAAVDVGFLEGLIQDEGTEVVRLLEAIERLGARSQLPEHQG